MLALNGTITKVRKLYYKELYIGEGFPRYPLMATAIESPLLNFLGQVSGKKVSQFKEMFH